MDKELIEIKLEKSLKESLFWLANSLLFILDKLNVFKFFSYFPTKLKRNIKKDLNLIGNDLTEDYFDFIKIDMVPQKGNDSSKKDEEVGRIFLKEIKFYFYLKQKYMLLDYVILSKIYNLQEKYSIYNKKAWKYYSIKDIFLNYYIFHIFQNIEKQIKLNKINPNSEEGIYKLVRLFSLIKSRLKYNEGVVPTSALVYHFYLVDMDVTRDFITEEQLNSYEGYNLNYFFCNGCGFGDSISCDSIYIDIEKKYIIDFINNLPLQGFLYFLYGNVTFYYIFDGRKKYKEWFDEVSIEYLKGKRNKDMPPVLTLMTKEIDWALSFLEEKYGS